MENFQAIRLGSDNWTHVHSYFLHRLHHPIPLVFLCIYPYPCGETIFRIFGSNLFLPQCISSNHFKIVLYLDVLLAKNHKYLAQSLFHILCLGLQRLPQTQNPQVRVHQ